MCFFKFYFLANLLIQSLQMLSFFWSWTHEMCVSKSFIWTKLFWQISHLNFSFFHDQFQVDPISMYHSNCHSYNHEGYISNIWPKFFWKILIWILFSFMINFNVPFKLQESITKVTFQIFVLLMNGYLYWVKFTFMSKSWITRYLH